MSHGAPISATPALPAWEQFLENNFKKLLILFVAVVIGLGLYGTMRYLSHSAEVKAGEAFAAAKSVEDLDLVISTHKGTAAAASALLQKADLLWDQNKKTTSVEMLQEFVNNQKSHPLFAQALLGLGTKLESLGKRAEAKPVFERLVAEFGKSELAALAELRLGDLAWAEGKEDEAKKIYEGLPAKFAGASADNSFIPQSESRLEWIAAKLPTKEVDGPPKPKVETPAPGAPKLPGFNLNSANGSPLAPTVAVPGSNAPAINLTPGGTTTPITVTPSGAVMPSAPAVAPASAPKIEVKPVPSVPVTPKIEVKPAPAPAAPTPAVPAAPKIEVKPAPAAPAPASPAKPAGQ